LNSVERPVFVPLNGRSGSEAAVASILLAPFRSNGRSRDPFAEQKETARIAASRCEVPRLR
jgi:hypothetical protein